jgi:DNA-binding NarL/FixJ family response regulator
MAKIRLLLLYEDRLFWESLGRLLNTERDFQIVAHCSTSEQALHAVARTPVDLVLLDNDLGVEDGFEFISKAHEAGHAGKIFIVTAGMTDADSVRALGYGVSRIFLKYSSSALLTEAIRKVIIGETRIDQSTIQAVVQAVDRSDQRKRRMPLPAREREVLNGVFEGLSNKEIALRLCLSEASVKSAIRRLFVKTGIRTRSQLVRLALQDCGTVWGLRP